jgi:hypothetical protein
MASMTLKIEEDTSNSTVQKIELPKIREKKKKHGHHFAGHAEETKSTRK